MVMEPDHQATPWRDRSGKGLCMNYSEPRTMLDAAVMVVLSFFMVVLCSWITSDFF
jgi:hypothetical protein